MSRLRRLSYLALGMPVPLVPYVFWRWWVADGVSVVFYVLLPVALLAAAMGLMRLLRRRSLLAMSVPTAALVLGIGLCLLAYVHGRHRVEVACAEALRLPLGASAAVLRQMAADPDVSCAVSDRVNDSWFVRVETETRDLGSMWFVLDDNDELVLRKAALEPLAGDQTRRGRRDS